MVGRENERWGEQEDVSRDWLAGKAKEEQEKASVYEKAWTRQAGNGKQDGSRDKQMVNR